MKDVKYSGCLIKVWVGFIYNHVLCLVEGNARLCGDL